MSDRCCVIFRQPEGDVVVYSHYEGLDIGELLRDSLFVAEGCLADPSYCTRICVTEMTASGICNDGITRGWGLGPKIPRNQNGITIIDRPTFLVDLAAGQVSLLSDENSPQVIWGPVSFQEFIKLPDANIQLRY